MTTAGVVDSRLKKAVDWKIFELQSLLISDDVDQGTVNDSLHWLQERHYLEVIEERANDNRCGYPLCENALKSKKKGTYRIDYNDKKVYSVEKSHMFCCDQCIEKSQKLEIRFDNSLPYSRKVISTLDLNISSKKGIDDILSLLGSNDDTNYQNKVNNNNNDNKYITKDAAKDIELQSTVSDLSFKGSDIMSNNGELNVEFINGLPVVVPNRLIKNMSESTTAEDRRRINELTKNLSVDVNKKSHIEIQKKYLPSSSSSAVSNQASLPNQGGKFSSAQDPTQSVVYNNIRMDYKPEDIPLDEIVSAMSSIKAKYEAKHQQHSSPKYQDNNKSNNNSNNSSPKYQNSQNSPKSQNGSPKYGGGDVSPKSNNISVNSIASKKIVNTIDNSNKTIDEIMGDFVITRSESSLTTSIHDVESKKKSTTSTTSSTNTTIRSAISHIGPKTVTWDSDIRKNKGVKDSSFGINNSTTVGSSSASLSSTISSGSHSTMHFEVRERINPTVMSERAILSKKEPYSASVIKLDGNNKSGIYGRSALASGALNVLHAGPIEERTYIDHSDISSSHNNNISNTNNRKPSLISSMIQEHRPMNTSSIQEHRLHYGTTATDTEETSLNKPLSISEMASSVEGYIMQFNDSIRVAPITTMRNLSYFPFAKKSTTAIDYESDDDDADVIVNDAVVVGDSKDDDLYDEGMDEDIVSSQHSNNNQQSLFYIIWSTMDELFPFAASILNDDKNHDSSHIVAIIEHTSNNDGVLLASDVGMYVPVQQISTEAIVMKLLTKGVLSAEKRLNIFQRYLISTFERDQYHRAKGQLLTYANKILRRVALSNAYGPPQVAPTVHSAGWTLIGLLIVEAIIKKKFIGPYFGLDTNSNISGNVAVIDWSDKIEQMCKDILITKTPHYNAAYKLRPDDLKILRSFFDCIKA